jgi:hypothetical protein
MLSQAVAPETIAALVADLAKQTGVDPVQITLVSAEPVTWRDGSLGCPKPGMMYPQMLIDGFRVVFAAEGKQYAFHGDSRGNFSYCANPAQ